MKQEMIYNLEEHDSKEEAYQGLTEAISDISVSSVESIDVAWASENYKYKTTKYIVTDKGSRYGEDTLKIRGHGGKETGGNYEIIPKPNSSPRIVYYLPDTTIGWDEAAKMLLISPSRYGFMDPEDEDPIFVEFVDNVRDRVGL